MKNTEIEKQKNNLIFDVREYISTSMIINNNNTSYSNESRDEMLYDRSDNELIGSFDLYAHILEG